MSKYNFKGWNLKEFLKGRKELFVTLIGAVGTFLVTSNPTLSVVVGAGLELVYSIIDYWSQE